MGGSLDPEETPAGGLTMILSLPAAESEPGDGEADPGRRERAAQPAVDARPAVDAQPAVDARPAVDAQPVDAQPAVDAQPGGPH
jgi:hypothetical protein